MFSSPVYSGYVMWEVRHWLTPRNPKRLDLACWLAGLLAGWLHVLRLHLDPWVNSVLLSPPPLHVWRAVSRRDDWTWRCFATNDHLRTRADALTRNTSDWALATFAILYSSPGRFAPTSPSVSDVMWILTDVAGRVHTCMAELPG